MPLATIYLCKPKSAALKFKGLYAALAALVASGVPQTEDVFVQKGFKVLVTARNVVCTTGFESILAPSYRLYPRETTEKAQISAAMRAYGVRPAGRRV